MPPTEHNGTRTGMMLAEIKHLQDAYNDIRDDVKELRDKIDAVKTKQAKLYGMIVAGAGIGGGLGSAASQLLGGG